MKRVRVSYYVNDNAAVFSDEVLPTGQPEIALSGEAKEIVSTMIQDALYSMSAEEAANAAQESMLNIRKKADLHLPDNGKEEEHLDEGVRS